MHRIIGRLVVVVLATVACQLPVAPASAHGANGLSPTSEQTVLTSVTPASDAFSARVIGFGDKIEIRRTGTSLIEIPGYQNEPYLRVDDQGVWRNNNSPTRWSNEDRDGLTPLPTNATVNALPDWEQLSDRQWVQWHDHRAHTMVDFELLSGDGVVDDEDGNVIQRFSIDIQVDQQLVTVNGQITQLQPPSSLQNLLLLLVVAGCCTALLIAAARHSRLLPTAIGALGLVVLTVSLVHAWGAAVFAGDQLNQSTTAALWLSSYFAVPGWLALGLASTALLISRRKVAGLLFGFGLLSTVAYGGLLDWSALTNALTINTLDPAWVRILVISTLGIGLPLAVHTMRAQWHQSRAVLRATDQNAGSLQDTNDVAT